MRAVIGTQIQEAAARLREGQLVALPTETVYGLGANALDERAVARIFSAKNRPSFDPLIVHQSSAERVLAYARSVPGYAHQLATAFWPGPLTLVLPRAAGVPDLVTAGLSTLAMRVPDHPLTLEVLSAVDFPVAAPSANPFGFVSPVTAGHVADQLGERVDYILDGGPCRVGLESTIVDCTAADPVVLRRGGLPLEAIEELLGRPVAARTHGSSRPAAPGMLSRHYSPGVRLELLPTDAPFPERVGERTAVISFGPGPLPDAAWSRNLSPTGDLEEAARRLFTVLRELATAGVERAIVRLVPERGLGRAINDRLRRAAVPPGEA